MIETGEILQTMAMIQEQAKAVGTSLRNTTFGLRMILRSSAQKK